MKKLIKIDMGLDKSTKTTHMYRPVDEKDKETVPNFYIKKTALPMVPPHNITVEITFTK